MKIRFLMFAVLIIGLSLIVGLDHYHRDRQQLEKQLRLESVLENSARYVLSGLRERRLVVDQLAVFLANSDSIPSEESFNRYATASMVLSPFMRALQFVDADRHIRYIYPLKGNEAALNLDLRTRPLASAWVERSFLEKRSFVADPQRTIQDSFSVVIRSPILVGDEVRGLAQGVVDIDTLLKDLPGLLPEGIALHIQDSSGVTFWKSGDVHDVKLTRQVGEWTLQLSSEMATASRIPDFTLWVLWSLGLALIACLLFILNRVGQGMQQLHTTVVKTHEDLQASDQRFRVLIEGAAEGIVVADRDSGRFLYANDAMCRFLGYTREEFMALSIKQIHPPDHFSALRREFDAVGATKSHTLEVPCRTSDGGCVYADISASLITFDGIHCNLGFFMDVTERVRMREDNQALEAHLRQAQKMESIGTFAAGVAHEINNPILAISSLADLIEDELPGNSCTLEMTGSIKKEIMRIHDIVKNLLGFARIETNTTAQPEDICAIIRSTVSLTFALMKHDHIQLDVEIPSSLPEVLCLRQHIQQVLMNLLTNARDALNDTFPQSDPRKRIRLSAALKHSGEERWIRIGVEDWGPGIPDQLREKIFDPFFTTKPHDKGTGLGLWIVYGILKEHGARIELESEVGRFTRFWVDLPVRVEAPWVPE